MTVFNAACYQGNGHLMRLGTLQDSIRNLAHQRLSVGGSFACDDEGSIVQQSVEPNRVEQEVDARPTFSIHILQERIAKSACGSCTRLILTIVAEVSGRDFGKPFGSGIEQLDHFLRGPLLWGKHMSGSVLSTQGIGDIGCNREMNGIELVHIIP